MYPIAVQLGNAAEKIWHADLRSRLGDRSAEGQQRVASQIRADLARVNAIDTSGLPHAVRTSVEVVRSAYATALEGFALPYGDVPVGKTMALFGSHGGLEIAVRGGSAAQSWEIRRGDDVVVFTEDSPEL